MMVRLPDSVWSMYYGLRAPLFHGPWGVSLFVSEDVRLVVPDADAQVEMC